MRKKEEKLIEEAKKISVREASAYSLMDGFGSRYITPFANAMGVSNTYIGMLTSIPSLLGNLAQLPSPKLMEKYSRKKIVFVSVLLQSIMWLALIFLGMAYFLFNLSRTTTSILLVAIYTILIIFGALAGPAWSSWMKDLVTKDLGDYFGRRSKIAGALALVFFFIGGFILDYFKQTKIFIAFVILFSLAFFGRFISTALFLKQYEPKLKLKDGYYFSFVDFVKKMSFNNFGRFSIFIALINFSVALSSPFFAIYLLENLQLNSIQFGYIFYTLISISASITSILFISHWGKFADKFGNYKVMKITGYFIPLMPLYYLFSSFMIGKVSIIGIIFFFICCEAFSGWVWSGFNLAAGNYIYDAVTRERIAICVAYYSVIVGFGVFLGATIGGFISSMNFMIFGLSPILFIFILSALARFIVVLTMVSKIKEVREISLPVYLKKEIAKDKKSEYPEGKSIKRFHIASLLSSLQNKLSRPRPGDN